jgi:2-dehydro-3-deoxyphosphogluconate aldolase / (4S)-4-hydroxy-2-oxoglutarate aldolase
VEKKSVITNLNSCKILPIYSHDDKDIVVEVVKACYQGGCRAFEFTNRVADSIAIFKYIKQNQHLYADMVFGVGTIMNAATAESFISAGADFIVSPMLKIEIGAVCSKSNVVWIPGCATPTEIITADDHGADYIKLFPASSLGPSFLSGVLSIAPKVKFVVTGGIEPDRESISAWYKAGAKSIGLGSNLLKKDLIMNKQWAELQREIQRVIEIAQAFAGK